MIIGSSLLSFAGWWEERGQGSCFHGQQRPAAWGARVIIVMIIIIALKMFLIVKIMVIMIKNGNLWLL